MPPEDDDVKGKRVMIRITDRQYQWLQKEAARETKDREVDVSVAWVIRRLIERGRAASRGETP